MDIDQIVRRAKPQGVKLVSFLYCDNGGVLRGKSVHVSRLAERMRSGVGLTAAMQAMTDMDELQSVPGSGMGPVGETRLVPDADTFAIAPYAPRRASMMCDMMTPDLLPYSACPRGFLKRAMAKAAEMGLTIQAAFEPEWYFARETEDGEFVPIDRDLVNAATKAMKARDVVDDIVEWLEAQGLEVEQYYPELGHGQHELSIRHADALRAADNHLALKETVRNAAYKHGMLASFAPKPFPEQAGNGCHIHLSAWDADGETNLFYDQTETQNLSELGYGFIAGVMRHMPALMALSCPSVNSYRRLQPGTWSSAYMCYGPDNREAALRIPSRFSGAEMASTNIEYRPADSSANPYIALGGLIFAGLDGIENGLRPDERQNVDVDPRTLSQEELAARGIRRYPMGLPQATAHLQADSMMMEAMGADLANSYIAIRRANSVHCSTRGGVEYEVRHHFHKY